MSDDEKFNFLFKTFAHFLKKNSLLACFIWSFSYFFSAIVCCCVLGYDPPFTNSWALPYQLLLGI